MRVVLVTDADVFAGTENHMFTLAEALTGLGTHVQIAGPPSSPLVVRAAQAGLITVSLPRGGAIDQLAIRRLARLLSDRVVDVIHPHNGRTSLLAAGAVQLAGRGRLVFTQHFLRPARADRRGIKGMASRLIHGWMSRRVDQFIAVSGAARHEMVVRGDSIAERVTVIPNGIRAPNCGPARESNSVRVALGVPQSARLVACLARLRSEKAVPLLVRAMAQVVKVLPDAHCIIAGEGPEHNSITETIRGLRLEHCVRLVGFREDVAAVLQAADLLALPSPAEPFGLVLLEAMALAKPVVAMAAGGPLEIVEHGRTGLLCTPGDASGLAWAIIELLSDEVRSREMGAEGRRQFLDRFTAERMARQTLSVYEKAMAPRGDGFQ